MSLKAKLRKTGELTYIDKYRVTVQYIILFQIIGKYLMKLRRFRDT